MVIFESVPKFYVSAAVFLPDVTRFKPPYPAVLVVCGHSYFAKSYEILYAYYHFVHSKTDSSGKIDF
jgi:hypothetical protein